jgi:hypothetical protein
MTDEIDSFQRFYEVGNGVVFDTERLVAVLKLVVGGATPENQQFVAENPGLDLRERLDGTGLLDVLARDGRVLGSFEASLTLAP